MRRNFEWVTGVVAFGLIVSIGGSAFAQLQTNTAPSGTQTIGNTASPFGSGSPNQPGSLSFEELEVKVTQVVWNDQQKTMRVILEVVERAADPRAVAFVQPPATMIDSMGNQWYATASNGIRICGIRKLWDETPIYCNTGMRSGKHLIKLTKDLPQIAVLDFTPADGSIIENTLKLIRQATLNARVIVALKSKKFSTVDINIPGIALPQ